MDDLMETIGQGPPDLVGHRNNSFRAYPWPWIYMASRLTMGISTMAILPTETEPAYWRQVGIITLVWTILLVVAGVVLILYGDSITNVLF